MSLPPSKAKRLLMSPGPIFEPEGEGRRLRGARHARSTPRASAPATSCTIRFAYHLTPGGFILESGAHALGCAVIPGGVGNTEQQLEAIAHYKPSGYVGTPDFLKILLDTAREDRQGRVLAQARRSFPARRCPASLREELAQRGVAVLQCYAIAELGVHRLRERRARGHDRQRERHRGNRAAGHRRSGAGRRGRRGRGHLVQSGLSDDPPRAPAISPQCCRARRRADAPTRASRAGWAAPIRPRRSRACSCIRSRSRRSPRGIRELGRLRLVVGRAAEQDTMTLLAECARRRRPEQRGGRDAAGRHQAQRRSSLGRARARCRTTAR